MKIHSTLLALLGLSLLTVAPVPASANMAGATHAAIAPAESLVTDVQFRGRRGVVVRRGFVGPRRGVVVRRGGWVRPRGYWWRPGGAIAAGAALGVLAAGAAVWAGAPPAPGYCWYYTDPSRRQGFWDVCQ